MSSRRSEPPASLRSPVLRLPGYESAALDSLGSRMAWPVRPRNGVCATVAPHSRHVSDRQARSGAAATLLSRSIVNEPTFHRIQPPVYRDYPHGEQDRLPCWRPRRRFGVVASLPRVRLKPTAGARESESPRVRSCDCTRNLCSAARRQDPWPLPLPLRRSARRLAVHHFEPSADLFAPAPMSRSAYSPSSSRARLLVQ